QIGANLQVVIGGHQGDGILIRGEGTDENNIVNTQIIPPKNQGHGIQIADGVQNMFIGGQAENSQVEIEYTGDGKHGIFLNGNNSITPLKNINIGYHHIGIDPLNQLPTPSIPGDSIHIEGNVDGVVIGAPGLANHTCGAGHYGVAIVGSNVQDVS